jgi:dihydrofolate reductase
VVGELLGRSDGRRNERLHGEAVRDAHRPPDLRDLRRYWPHADAPGADVINGSRKHVASRRLERTDWQNSTLIQGDVVDYVRKLKDEQGPEIQVHGSGELIQTLLRNDLIDELRLWIFPVVLGTGKRLFADGTIPAGLRLVDSKTSTTGVILATYERAGAIEYGSFAPQAQASE